MRRCGIIPSAVSVSLHRRIYRGIISQPMAILQEVDNENCPSDHSWIRLPKMAAFC